MSTSFYPWLIIRYITSRCSSGCCFSLSHYSNSFGSISLLSGSSSVISESCSTLFPRSTASKILHRIHLFVRWWMYAPLNIFQGTWSGFPNYQRSWNSLYRLFGLFKHNSTTSYNINPVGAVIHRCKFLSVFPLVRRPFRNKTQSFGNIFTICILSRMYYLRLQRACTWSSYLSSCEWQFLTMSFNYLVLLRSLWSRRFIFQRHFW